MSVKRKPAGISRSIVKHNFGVVFVNWVLWDGLTQRIELNPGIGIELDGLSVRKTAHNTTAGAWVFRSRWTGRLIIANIAAILVIVAINQKPTDCDDQQHYPENIFIHIIYVNLHLLIIRHTDWTAYLLINNSSISISNTLYDGKVLKYLQW